MGFRYDTGTHRDKNAPQKASGIGMILIFIVLGVSVWLGWWLPPHVPLREYLPIPSNWSLLTLQIVVGVAAFILLQFLVVLVAGLISPPRPKDEYEEDAKKLMRENVPTRTATGLAWYQWVWAGLPLILIAVGGAIGGALAGLAIVINVGIFRSDVKGIASYVLTAIVSIIAIIAYFAVVPLILASLGR